MTVFRPSHDRFGTAGLRERKRLELRQRITTAALRLFLAHGYEATTVDAIAKGAGISRRTFFSYFESKDDILIWWQDEDWTEARTELLETSPDRHPLDAVRDVMVKNVSRYTSDQMRAIDTLIRSSPALMARKQTFYAEQEQALFATLCQVWRQPERRLALRMVAMVSIGALKLAIQLWQEAAGARGSMAEVLESAFASLAAEVAASDKTRSP